MTIVKIIVVIVTVREQNGHDIPKDLTGWSTQEKTQAFRDAQRSFEDEISSYPLDDIEGQIAAIENELKWHNQAQKIDKLNEELEAVSQLTCAEIVKVSKLRLIEACKHHHDQYDEMKKAKDFYGFKQYLKYHGIPDKKSDEQDDAATRLETISFRLAEEVDEDGQVVGECIDVHFNLPNNFILAANSGSHEVQNWLYSVENITLEMGCDLSSGRPLRFFTVGYWDIEQQGTSMAEDLDIVLRRIFERESGGIQQAKDANEKLKTAIDILPKIAGMKLCPTAIKNIPIA